ncbi:MAG: signal peptidase [Solirubrobacteraceae bacterium]|nr:signal peptidase [Solirubrobacteraceae bacterium]
MQSADSDRGSAWLRAGTVLAVVVACDQLAKALVRANIARGERRNVFFGVDLVNVRNKGIAFGLFDGGGALLTALTLAALVLLVAYFATHADRPLVWLPTGLLVGGALGNMLDRLTDHAVTDFIDVPLWPSFNLADVAITCGVAALLFVLEGGGRSGSREQAGDERAAGAGRGARA